MDYKPREIDLFLIPLPEDITDELIETLAANVHNVWAQERIKDGWTYGPQRVESLKQTPCLVPYDQLPETEKDYDRNTAITTLKLICKMGFDIKKK